MHMTPHGMDNLMLILGGLYIVGGMLFVVLYEAITGKKLTTRKKDVKPGEKER